MSTTTDNKSYHKIVDDVLPIALSGRVRRALTMLANELELPPDDVGRWARRIGVTPAEMQNEHWRVRYERDLEMKRKYASHRQLLSDYARWLIDSTNQSAVTAA